MSDIKKPKLLSLKTKFATQTGTGKRVESESGLLSLAGIGAGKKQNGEAKSQGGPISSPPEQRKELGFQAKAPDPVLPEHKDAEARQESNKQAAKAEWQSHQSAGVAASSKSWASGMRQQIQQVRASLQAPAQKQELSK